MKFVLSIYDAICQGYWKLFRFLARIVISIGSSLVGMLQWMWNGLGKISFSRPVWKIPDAIFGAIGAIWRAWPVRWVPEMVQGTTRYLDRKLEHSGRWRRGFLPVSALLLALWFCPPSHWGPWYLYQTGISSHYGTGFYFQRTANCDWFLPCFHTAAHRTLPLGITAKVVNLENGKSVYVLINDRGPYVEGRILDLSTAAGKAIGLYGPGTAKVAIYVHHLPPGVREGGGT